MARPVIGVVGLGTMGLGIAQVYAQAGFDVTATDANPVARSSAAARLADVLEPRVAAGKMSGEQRNSILSHFRVAGAVEELGGAGLVIEAIVEQLDAKRALFAALEQVVAPDAVLATNTSSLPVGAIAEGLSRPERLLGLHFFNPAQVMKLVELVAHGGTSVAALVMARTATEASGKTVIGCADRPGFIVNRCARPFYGEALALLEEGRTASDIDASMMTAGYRIGPLSLIDLIGADVHLAATEGVWQAMGRHPRYHVFDALKQQVAKGDLGRKTGRGFVFPDRPGAPPPDAGMIVQRIEATLANEAASLLDEGGVDEASIDTAMMLGLNFPQGPLTRARAREVESVITTLSQLAASAPPHLAGRYDVVPALTNLEIS